MLELHMSKGTTLTWLQAVYKPEEKTLIGYNVEWMRNIKRISVADTTVKRFLRSPKTIAGGEALWLPYTPGAINYTPSRGLDVISGPFSGCIMAAYDSGKGRRVCHVSTAGEGEHNDCKALWEGIKETCTACVEFRPHEASKQFSFKKLKSFGAPVFFGLITGDDRCYTVIADRSSGVITARAVVPMTPTKMG